MNIGIGLTLNVALSVSNLLSLGHEWMCTPDLQSAPQYERVLYIRSPRQKDLTLKPQLLRSMTRWAYLWQSYLWSSLMFLSYGTVNSNIDMLDLDIKTRSGLLDVGNMSGGCKSTGHYCRWV